jgi:MoxR-like ATPase
MLESQRQLNHPVESITALTEPATILALQEQVVGVHVDPGLRDYILNLVQATREDQSLRLGVSPRGSLALYKSCQAWAGMEGRSYITPEDIKELAPEVFKKRIILTAEASIKNIKAERIIASILDRVPVPAFKEGV